MRSSLLWGLLSLAFAAPSIGEATVEEKDDTPKATTFNGQEVPPMQELGEGIEKAIQEGNWMIEFFSPYCGHCKAFAPTWQTFYEFYYTSNPLTTSKPDGDHLNTFSRYYDFKFARVDCVANGDACAKYNVHSFPTVVLFKDGKSVKESVGDKSMEKISTFMEEALETIRPGSRPKEGLKLPKAGDKSVAVGAKPEKPAAKDKDPEGGAIAASKHNEIASAVESEAAAASPTKKGPVKPTETPNPKGVSTPLTAETFQKLVTTTRDAWFVKFYAPWCHHCQALAPNWVEMAREMKGQLNIGEVNCDIDKRLCKDARIKGYPTILYFRGGERVEYDGLRGVGDLISYANKAIDLGSGVPDVTEAQFNALEEKEEVIFVYFYDHATTTEDFSALERLTLSLIGHAKLVRTKDAKLAERFKISTWPRLMVSRDGKPTYYEKLAPAEMRDYRQVLTWMQNNWTPIVPELTASNAREIMNNRIIVLAILSRERGEFNLARREIKSAALEWIDKESQRFRLARQELRDSKQLRIEEAEDRGDQKALKRAKEIRIREEDIERREVGFAWVDGVFWERWIRTTFGIDVRDGERVIINDEDNHRYWDQTITGNYIMASRTSILETLPKVLANPPKIPHKSTTGPLKRFFFSITALWRHHPVFAGVALVACVLAAAWVRVSGRVRGRNFGAGGWISLGGEAEKGLGLGKAD
ncbi:putative disulfide isomerase [Aulographum hederae CBS 113979]|uniref:Putative disulfide isomerase n=1 Tax=Aulographum hederae CBS 113979 TaxID=1176131 RepID=A0A6G1GPB5_9PEZI|nr:putative disulfide isomerase [Aulographum hederae CBS 113979]